MEDLECAFCENGLIEETCGTCNGSGEGMCDGTTCSTCHGDGTAVYPCDCPLGQQYKE
jgi:DnaJ-class molecular chaperone